MENRASNELHCPVPHSEPLSAGLFDIFYLLFKYNSSVVSNYKAHRFFCHTEEPTTLKCLSNYRMYRFSVSMVPRG